MILSLQNVPDYLMDCGLVSSEAIVDGDLMIVSASRRNSNFKAIRRKGPGFFVKQIQIWNPQVSSELQREAFCYWMAQHDRTFAPLKNLVPRCAHYNPTRCILITELISGGESIAELHRRLGSFPAELGAALGRGLAEYHRLDGVSLQNHQYLSSFPRAVPWILSIHQMFNPFSDLSLGNRQMIGVLQQYPDYQRALDDLRDQWQRDSLIHGDMKWDNCVVEPQEAPERGLKLKIVDWELADIGDACWDVGAIFQAYLSFWVFSIYMPAGAPASQALHLAQYPVEAMQPAIRAFWEEYRDGMGFSGPVAEMRLERSARYAAARMIQTVFESLQRSPQLTPNALCLLQVSMNMLQSPREAIHDLLAL